MTSITRALKSGVRSLSVAAAIVSMLACALPVLAEDIPEIRILGERIKTESDLRIGGLEFNPYVVARAEYNDNIYRDSEHKKSDFIGILTPGFQMRYPFGNHRLQMDWQSSIYHFAEHTELNTISEHVGNIQLNLDFDKWFVRLQQGFAYLDEVGDPEFTERQQRWLSDSTAVVGVRFEPVDLSMDYTKSFRHWVFDPLHDQNYEQDLLGVRLDFKTFETLKPYLRYEFRNVDFNGDLNISKYGHVRRNNQHDHRVWAGLNGTIVQGLTWEVGVGWQHIRLETYHDTFEYRAPRDSDHLLAKARATWHVKPDSLMVSVFADRAAVLSTQADYADLFTVGAEVEQKWTDRWKSTFRLSHSYFNRAQGTDFTYFTGGASTTYRINKWASLLMRYDYTMNTPRNVGSGYNQSRITLGGIFAW